MNLTDIIARMAEHAAEFPNHKRNCACKDVYIRLIMNRLSELSYGELREMEYITITLQHLISDAKVRAAIGETAQEGSDFKASDFLPYEPRKESYDQ